MSRLFFADKITAFVAQQKRPSLLAVNGAQKFCVQRRRAMIVII